jgi:hypothetical protein
MLDLDLANLFRALLFQARADRETDRIASRSKRASSSSDRDIDFSWKARPQLPLSDSYPTGLTALEEISLTRTRALLSIAALSSLFPPSLLRAQAPGVPLTVEKIYAHGPLIGRMPADIEWSPDSKHMTYLVGVEEQML